MSVTTKKHMNHKTISLLAIICALLVFALFMYRTQYNTVSKVYTSENATMFPTARDIKPFTLVRADTQQAFTQKNFFGHWTLLFFGFTNCASICPTTLDTLAHAYDRLMLIKPGLQVVFVSLDPTRDTTEKLTAYTQKFHVSFIGVTGKINEIRKLQAQFHIFSVQDETSPGTSDVAANHNYQIQHTSSILLINPKGEWSGLFSFGMKPEQFANEFEMATNAAA